MTNPYEIRDVVADMLKNLNYNQYPETRNLINDLFDANISQDDIQGMTQKELESNSYYKRGWNDCLDSIVIPEPDLPNYLK